MSKLNLQPLTGMMELSPAAQIQFEKWRQIISETYSLYGFTPLDTPILERSEILLAKAGGETEKQIYRFQKGETDISMRFDLTVPLARYVAAYQNELAFPFRRQQIGRVYRGERAQKGRFREFYQADVDIIGRGELDLKYDGEIVSLVITTIKRLNLGKFQVRINNRKLILGFLQALKVMDEKEVLQILDKSEKIGESKMRDELSLLRLNGLEIRKIVKFAQIRGNFPEVYQELMRLDIDNDLFTQGIEELSAVEKTLQSLQTSQENYIFETSIVRGLDYYTGTIYETQLLEAKQLGSICSGGRYESLIASFSNAKMPGVGASIGLTRLFSQALELGLIDAKEKTVSKVVVLPLTENIAPVLEIAARMREANITTEIYLQDNDFKKKLKYANDLGVPYVLIVGDDEIAADKISLKNMTTGEQILLNLKQIIDLILEN